PLMTIIKATCPRCGGVLLSPDDVSLELAPDGRGGDYRFRCPKCTALLHGPANPRMVSVLLATGVTSVITTEHRITEHEIEAFVTALETESDPIRTLAR
ncbi:MAG: hypothetical protein ACRDZM_19535, partial [Acidimicrobiia bacterium]